jgi:hypothetical protein
VLITVPGAVTTGVLIVGVVVVTTGVVTTGLVVVITRGGVVTTVVSLG